MHITPTLLSSEGLKLNNGHMLLRRDMYSYTGFLVLKHMCSIKRLKAEIEQPVSTFGLPFLQVLLYQLW